MSGERCPTCGHAIPVHPKVFKSPRLCIDCGKQILPHHKYQWIVREGVSTVAHRHCDNPESYLPTALESPDHD